MVKSIQGDDRPTDRPTNQPINQPTNQPTNQLTPRTRVLPEKLTDPYLVKKFPAFYETWKCITTFTSAPYLSLSWVKSIQSMPPHPTSGRSILILSMEQLPALMNSYKVQTLIYSKLTTPMAFDTRVFAENFFFSISQSLALSIPPLPPKMLCTEVSGDNILPSNLHSLVGCNLA
jgi:hypothetical protein